MSTQSLLGVGLYTSADAARIFGVPPYSLVRWSEGYWYKYRDRKLHSDGIIQVSLDPIEGQKVYVFLDLMEARFIHAFRRHGVSLQAIRVAVERARELLKTTHPFCSKQFRTDGRSIFLDIAEDAGERSLLDLCRNQYEFRRLVGQYLYKGVQFGDDGRPRLWYPVEGNRTIVIDPARRFGQPILTRRGIPTRTLFLSFQGEQSASRVAWAFEIPENEVQAAIDYEKRLAA